MTLHAASQQSSAGEPRMQMKERQMRQQHAHTPTDEHHRHIATLLSFKRRITFYLLLGDSEQVRTQSKELLYRYIDAQSLPLYYYTETDALTILIFNPASRFLQHKAPECTVHCYLDKTCSRLHDYTVNVF